MKLNRKNKLLIGLVVVAIILIAKLFSIQIINDKYKMDAENNSMVYSTIFPTRGIINDRYGNILVGNKVAYDLLVTPREIEQFDTLTFCKVLDVTPEFVREKMEEFRKNRRKIGYQSVVMLKQIPPETYMRFAEVAYKFPGFRGQARSIREYPFNAGGNLLGYVSEVNQKFIEQHPGEYRSGDYAGQTGIEAAREKELRGVKGYNIYLRNSKNKIESRYKDGEFDKEAIPGDDIMTTIDAELQHYGQMLMANKVGSLVAIEPSTGEILTMVSSPGIDVEMLADIGRHYGEISSNPYKPMFNRAVQAPYPPGSVFKLVNGLIGLEEGVITPDVAFPCSNGFLHKGLRVGCHPHFAPIPLVPAIATSCNAYFCWMLNRMFSNRDKYETVQDAMTRWKDHLVSMGFGYTLGVDLPGEKRGMIPNADFYDRAYKGSWNALTVISISIGQGEVTATPLQIANLAATIANRGHYYVPHVVKAVQHAEIDSVYRTPHYTMVDPKWYDYAVEGMRAAVTGGTCRAANIPGIEVCGKTGTAQNRGQDHSAFMGFAPMNDPKIAVAVYVENGGYGATFGVPLGKLIMEQYLNGELSETSKLQAEAFEQRSINYGKTER